MTLNPRFKLILDYLPLAVFFAGFKLAGLYAATAALIVTTLASLAIIYAAERRVAIAPLVTAVVVGIAGALTLWLHDERFIKMKPTVINLVFAAILFVGCLRGKGLLRYVLGPGFSLTERGWYVLSLRFGLFFLFLAGLNELVWRNVPLDWWVNFKVFGLIGLTMLFALSQAGFIARHEEKKS